MTTDKLVLKTDELDLEINSFNFYLVYYRNFRSITRG